MSEKPPGWGRRWVSQPAPAQQGCASHVPDHSGDPAGSWALNRVHSPGCSQQGPGEGRPSLQPTGSSLYLLCPELPRKGGEEAVHPQRGVCHHLHTGLWVPLGSMDGANILWHSVICTGPSAKHLPGHLVAKCPVTFPPG